jgi:hypothetical protein
LTVESDEDGNCSRVVMVAVMEGFDAFGFV